MDGSAIPVNDHAGLSRGIIVQKDGDDLARRYEVPPPQGGPYFAGGAS